VYGKIFESMYEGTLYGQWEALVTMQQLIVLADQHGVIDMTPPAISGKTSIPLDIIEKGLAILSAPDPYSRTPGEDGIRIRLMDDHRPWGWEIVNYKKYRDMVRREDKRKADRERIAEKRKSLKRKESRKVSQSVANVAHTDTDTYTDKSIKHTCNDVALVDGFDDFWQQYPKKRNKKKSRDIWKRKRLDTIAVDIVLDVISRKTSDERWTAGYIPDPTTYLNGERWQDEYTDTRGVKRKTYTDELNDYLARGDDNAD
jgi:hypothetical protein